MIKQLLTWVFRIVFSVFLIAAIIYFLRVPIVSRSAEPKLERVLTGLFNMPVHIEGLEADILNGHVKAKRITFMNQPEFAKSAHLDVVKGLEFQIDFPALRNKEVLISNVKLKQPFYFIDRVDFGQGPRNNVSTWVYHIRYGRKKKKQVEPTAPPVAVPQPQHPSKGWHVKVDPIEIQNGIFIFDDRTKETPNRFVFRNLNGFLAGFEWPTKDPSHLNQRVEVEGTIGEKYPAKVKIKGRANFATGSVSFDLYGQIFDAALAEYQRFWDGLPIVLEEGKFNLDLRLICLRRKLRSNNILELSELKLTSPPSVVDKVWGAPILASIAFLHEQKKVRLKVPVNGMIDDPQFDFPKAFRAAFQDALKNHTVTGIKLLTLAPTKIVTETPQIALKTPVKIVEGLEKISTIVVPKKEEVKNG